MLQQDTAQDFVIATGKAYSVLDFVKTAFKEVGLEGEENKYLVSDPKFMRPSEVDLLIGDASKAKEILGWAPTLDFAGLVKKMVLNDLEIESNRAGIKLA